jgi:hypothetical protein
MTEQHPIQTLHDHSTKPGKNRTLPFLFLLAGLSVLSGHLLSKINIIGRAGIALFYKEYRFFKYWWKGTLAVFGTLLFLFWLQGYLQRKLDNRQATLLHVTALVIAVIGLYLTYSDFRNDVSHRVVGERFHLGFYLFWLGWMLVSLFYLFQNRQQSQ